MKSSVPTRVNYFDKQFLRRNEFVDEQAYQIDLRRRHNIAHHSWGIVVGLEIAIEGQTLCVRPGLAVDGYGRELFLTAKVPISEDEFNRLGSSRLDVWLYYEAVENLKTPAGYAACDAADQQYRLSEKPRVVFERARPGHIVSRRPPGVPAALLDSPAQLRTTDNPLDVWPVYLGRVTNVPQKTEPQEKYIIDASDRPYVGIAAETIDHPGKGNRVSLGSLEGDNRRRVGGTEYVYETQPNWSFAVYVSPDEPASLADPEVEEVSLDARFAIDKNDTNYLRGQTGIEGNLQIKGGMQFTDAIAEGDLQLSSDSRDPILYRAGPKAGDSDSSEDELRIDLGPVEMVQGRKLVIGFTSADGKFLPSVTLEYKQASESADPLPVMTIEGDLTLKGKVNCQSLITRSLSPETLNALLASFQAGSIAAGGQ
jgi:hypothetical protein